MGETASEIGWLRIVLAVDVPICAGVETPLTLPGW